MFFSISQVGVCIIKDSSEILPNAVIQLDRWALCKTCISKVLILTLWNSTAHILMYLKNQMVLLCCSQTLANTSNQHQNCVLDWWFFSKLWCVYFYLVSSFETNWTFTFFVSFGVEMLLDMFFYVQQQVKCLWERQIKGFWGSRGPDIRKMEVWKLELFSTLGHSLAYPSAILDPNFNWSMLMPITIPFSNQHALRDTSHYANSLLLSFEYKFCNFIL